jgi:glutaryl-CoA dehydrogenase
VSLRSVWQEAIHTFEGTETMQTLIVGREITGIGAFT